MAEQQEGKVERAELVVEGLELHIIQQAIVRHKDYLTGQRSKIAEAVPAAAHDIDSHLEVIRTRFYPVLGIETAEEEKARKAANPDQMDLTTIDYATHAHTSVEQTREYVARLIDEAATPAAAVMALNRLEDGENQRTGGPRQNHLDSIRAARSPLAKKVEKLTTEEGAKGRRPGPRAVN